MPRLKDGRVVMRIDRKMVFCAFLSLLAVPSGLLAQAQTEAPAKPAADCAELAETKARLEAQEKRLRDWPDLARYREASLSASSLAPRASPSFPPIPHNPPLASPVLPSEPAPEGRSGLQAD